MQRNEERSKKILGKKQSDTNTFDLEIGLDIDIPKYQIVFQSDSPCSQFRHVRPIRNTILVEYTIIGTINYFPKCFTVANKSLCSEGVRYVHRTCIHML